MIDDNYDLVWGWAKETNMISNHQVPPNSQNLWATIEIAPISIFITPIFGVPDDGNTMPHSYLFLPPWSEWPDLFVRRAKDLLEKTQQQDET